MYILIAFTMFTAYSRLKSMVSGFRKVFHVHEQKAIYNLVFSHA